jgi:hypothetical protein
MLFFIPLHTTFSTKKKKAQNMIVHGTRYCRLNFVVIEQEMGEKFGGVAEGGLQSGRTTVSWPTTHQNLTVIEPVVWGFPILL